MQVMAHHFCQERHRLPTPLNDDRRVLVEASADYRHAGTPPFESVAVSVLSNPESATIPLCFGTGKH